MSKLGQGTTRMHHDQVHCPHGLDQVCAQANKGYVRLSLEHAWTWPILGWGMGSGQKYLRIDEQILKLRLCAVAFNQIHVKKEEAEKLGELNSWMESPSRHVTNLLSQLKYDQVARIILFFKGLIGHLQKTRSHPEDKECGLHRACFQHV